MIIARCASLLLSPRDLAHLVNASQ